MSDFPTLGITLEGINSFINANRGRDVFTGLNTSDICEKFLKPTSKKSMESYCVTFEKDKGSSEIAPATIFVSHAWGHEFLDVIDALEDWDNKQATSGKAVFWFDIFSNNQHKIETRNFTWLQTVFKDNIGKLKHTCLILEWDDPNPFRGLGVSGRWFQLLTQTANLR